MRRRSEKLVKAREQRTAGLAGDQRAGVLAGGGGEEEARGKCRGENNGGQRAVLPEKQVGHDTHRESRLTGGLSDTTGDAAIASGEAWEVSESDVAAADEARTGTSLFSASEAPLHSQRHSPVSYDAPSRLAYRAFAPDCL